MEVRVEGGRGNEVIGEGGMVKEGGGERNEGVKWGRESVGGG